jgi:hypothetical protein
LACDRPRRDHGPARGDCRPVDAVRRPRLARPLCSRSVLIQHGQEGMPRPARRSRRRGRRNCRPASCQGRRRGSRGVAMSDAQPRAAGTAIAGSAASGEQGAGVSGTGA